MRIVQSTVKAAVREDGGTTLRTGEQFRLIGRTTAFVATDIYYSAETICTVRGVTLDGKLQTVARVVDVLRIETDEVKAALLAALVEALPWVEAQLDDPVNKAGTVRAVARRIRAAIEKAEAKP